MKNSYDKKTSGQDSLDEEVSENKVKAETIQPKGKKPKNSTPFYATSIFSTISVISVCLALVIWAIYSNSSEKKTSQTVTDTNTELQSELQGPDNTDDIGEFKIRSIDMLNYYSAVKIFDNTSSAKSDFSEERLYLKNTVVNINTSQQGFSLISQTGSSETIRENEESVISDYVCYELDPNTLFHISEVVMFKIELTDETGFLASKIGTGIAEVVLTKNNIEDMITFRNGNKYYSCCLNGANYTESEWEFSTHKYIQGFYIVKNFEQENYQFVVKFDKDGNASSLECQVFKSDAQNADRNISVIGETQAIKTNTAVTIAEIEEYFRSEILSESDTVDMSVSDTTDIYTDGTYVFELKSDNTFVYHGTDEDSEVSLKGSYIWGSEAVEFSFIYEGEVLETVNCALTGPFSFQYNGFEYIKIQAADTDASEENLAGID